jgi:hypothetical protein
MSGGRRGGGEAVNTPDSNESRNFTHVVHSTWCPPQGCTGRGGHAVPTLPTHKGNSDSSAKMKKLSKY